jgi:hypothetical protein
MKLFQLWTVIASLGVQNIQLKSMMFPKHFHKSVEEGMSAYSQFLMFRTEAK